MEINLEMIDRLAHLARIDLSDEEREAMMGHLGRILEAADVVCSESSLRELQGPRPGAFMRPDQVGISLSLEDATQNAPSPGADGFQVPSLLR